jgi:hypothetical protein
MDENQIRTLFILTDKEIKRLSGRVTTTDTNVTNITNIVNELEDFWEEHSSLNNIIQIKSPNTGIILNSVGINYLSGYFGNGIECQTTFKPENDLLYDLGTSSLKWRDIYSRNIILSNGITTPNIEGLTSSLVPEINNSIDLGSNLINWRKLFTGDIQSQNIVADNLLTVDTIVASSSITADSLITTSISGLTSSIIPNTHNSIDLGSSSKNFREIFTQDIDTERINTNFLTVNTINNNLISNDDNSYDIGVSENQWRSTHTVSSYITNFKSHNLNPIRNDPSTWLDCSLDVRNTTTRLANENYRFSEIWTDEIHVSKLDNNGSNINLKRSLVPIDGDSPQIGTFSFPVGAIHADEIFCNDEITLPLGSATDPKILFNNSGFNAGIYWQPGIGISFTLSNARRFGIGPAGVDVPNGYFKTRELYPITNNLYDCGSSSRKWDDIWATNGQIETSDLNEKNNINENDLGLNFISKIKTKNYKKKSGKSGRKHYGLLAQNIKEVLDEMNINTKDFAGYIYAPPKEEINNMGEVIGMSEETYALRYSEFIAPIIKSIQDLNNENNELKRKLRIQEDSIQDIYQRLIDLETENKRQRK